MAPFRSYIHQRAAAGQGSKSDALPCVIVCSALQCRVLSPTLQSALPKCVHQHHRVLSPSHRVLSPTLQSTLPKCLHLHHRVLSFMSQGALPYTQNTSQGSLPYVTGCSPLHFSVLSLNVYTSITGFSPLCHRVLPRTLQSAFTKSLHLHHGVLSLTSQSALLIDKLVRMVDYTSMSWLYILFSIMAI